MRKRRLICVIAVAAAAGWVTLARAQETLLLSSYETDADIAAWGNAAQRSAEHATHGEHSAKIVNAGDSYAGIGSANLRPSDWSGYDVMAVDVFNPQDGPVTFAIRIDDAQSRDYGSRYNRENFTCPPGRSTFELNITGLPTSNRLTPRKIDVANLKLISIFTLPGKPVTLYFDNLRLVKKETIAVAGLRAFDLGPKDAPLHPGFAKVTRDTMYDATAGFGWKYRANYERNEDHPNALFGDWVHGSYFLVDLPPGEYEVFMMLECPGQWNYYQNWKMRRVEAEGRAVVDETMDAETFLREYYYHFQDDEDLPDQDSWEKYILWRYKPKRFRVRVADGQLDLVLRDEGRGVPMSCLLIWPTGSDAQARKWLDKLYAGMKKEYDTVWLKVVHKEKNTVDAVADKLAGKKYVLFARDYSRNIYYNTVPAPEEIVDSVSVSAARGEYEPFYFGVFPVGDIGATRVEVTDLVGPGGAKIPAARVDIKKVQYRQRRGAGSYTCEPSLLKDFDRVDIRKGVTRGFWGTVDVGKDVPPGRYEGTITVTPARATEQRLRLTVEVLPVNLKDPDISLGILIGVPGYSVWYPEMEKTWWRDLELIMRDLRAHGMTCYCGGRGPVFKGVEGGEAVLDFAEADRTMEIAKAAGFAMPGDSYQGFNVRGLERADPAKLREQAAK